MKRDRNATDKMKNKKEFKKEIDYHRYWKDMYEKEHKLVEQMKKDHQYDSSVYKKELDMLRKGK
jgi:hypothetical protein